MQEINAFTFTPEGALSSLIEAGALFSTILFFVKKWQKSEGFNTKTIVKIFASSVLIYPFVMLIIGFVIALLFDNIEANFNLKTVTYNTFTFFLNGFIYGSFFISYYYFVNYRKQKEQLILYNQSLSESRINQLKSQLNPHFLFNNLNVLDQLIDEDKNKASEFLNEFADIYRYVLQTSDRKLISVHDEVIFAKQYFNIIHHKYGNAYQMVIESKKLDGYLVPMTFQLLIENAIQHNLGTDENPIYITIDIDENIKFSNTINLKRNIKLTSGRALNNLKEQYKLLTKTQIEIEQSSAVFNVIIPIVKTENA